MGRYGENCKLTCFNWIISLSEWTLSGNDSIHWPIIKSKVKLHIIVLNIKWIDFVIKSRRVIHLIKYELYTMDKHGLDGRECIHNLSMWICVCISDNLEMVCMIRITKKPVACEYFCTKISALKTRECMCIQTNFSFFMLIDYVHTSISMDFSQWFYNVLCHSFNRFVRRSEVIAKICTMHGKYWPPKLF